MSSDEEPTSTSASVKRKKYLQYYRKEWEKEFPGWLQDSRKGESYAYCKSCNKDINITSGKDAIKKHSSSQAHSVSSKNIKSQPKISSFTVTKTQKFDTLAKQGEIRLASFVAEHNLPFTIMEHLPKLMQAVCPDSKIAKEIKCSSTKTHDIIDHIIVLKGNAWVIWSCGLLVLLALCVLYIITLRSALRHWKESCSSVAVVLAVYPVVAAAALVSTVLPRVRILSEAVAQEAVMIAMYHFYFLIIAECGGTAQLVRRSEGSHMETRVLPCCCWPCCVLPRPRVQKKSLTWLRYLVLQMPVIQGILYLIVLMLWAEDMMLYLNSFIYIQPFIAASILSGVWGIIMCVRAAEATGAKPRPRFFALQLVLLIVKLQCGFAKVLPDLVTLPCIMALHPSVFVHLIHNIVMILEMLLLSLLAWRLYRVPPGKDAEKVQHVVIAVLEDSLNSLEKVNDIGNFKNNYSTKNDIKRDEY